jgi:hypothetical protein
MKTVVEGHACKCRKVTLQFLTHRADSQPRAAKYEKEAARTLVPRNLIAHIQLAIFPDCRIN